MASRQESSTRAGRYIAQPTGYRAFMPAPLPPQPAIDLTGELPALLSAADRATGRLDVYNGFLLSANLDALFDTYLASLDEEGRLLIAGTV